MNYLRKFFYNESDTFLILQLKSNPDTAGINFMRYSFLEKHGLKPERGNYNVVYADILSPGTDLEDIFEKFNASRPKDFTGHSLSVSDIVALKKDGIVTCHYVDSVGFREVPDFKLVIHTPSALEKYKEGVEFVSQLWCDFEAIPVDEATDAIQEKWNGFEAGTPCGTIHKWFWEEYAEFICNPLGNLAGGLVMVENDNVICLNETQQAYVFWNWTCTVDTDLVMQAGSAQTSQYQSHIANTTATEYSKAETKWLYFVVTTYSFDPEVKTVPFASEKEAWDYVEKTIQKEIEESSSVTYFMDIERFESGVKLIDRFADQRRDITTLTVASLPVSEIENVIEKRSETEPLYAANPLTRNELLVMKGQPVWTLGVSRLGAFWDIVANVDEDGVYFGYSTEALEWGTYNLRNEDGTLCDNSWVCYRKPLNDK